MKKIVLFFLFIYSIINLFSQNLSTGYIANDLTNHAMQPLNKPAYLGTVIDTSFPSTVIRRITDAGIGNVIAPIYSTIQSWNSDESLMLVYTSGTHQLLNGNNYSFIRTLSDINTDDIETIFWHFNDPNILFYLENGTSDFIEYNINTQVKTIVVNLMTISGCNSNVSLGNDVQMMSWDSDIFTFRCGNTSSYYYKISTSTLTPFNIVDIDYTAPMPFPSGNLFFHLGNIYNTNGNLVRTLNLDATNEHSCLGKLSNGDDAYFAIAFEEGPSSDCQGTLVAHNATNGNCYSITPPSDYGYPKTGTHISALSHKNTQGGWVAVSMIGYDGDGQNLLDQEIFIAKANQNNADVYRVAHHRSDENEFDYFGEPHVTISPTGTRLLFGSDWSGTEDGQSIDSYVVELFSHTLMTNTNIIFDDVKIYPNPSSNFLQLETSLDITSYTIYSINGELICYSEYNINDKIELKNISKGLYYIIFKSINNYNSYHLFSKI